MVANKRNKFLSSCFGIITLLAALAVGLLSVVLPETAFASSLPAYNYTKNFTSGVPSGDYVNADSVATDSAGNIYVVGTFLNGAMFNGTDTFTDRNIFLTKFNKAGDYQWTKVFDNASGWATANSVVVDNSGNIYLAGTFAGTVGFGGSDIITAGSGINNPFITKFNADGSYGWTRAFDTTGGHGNGQSVAVDGLGDVYTSGEYYGTVNFGGSDSFTAPGGNPDAYLSKFDANGNYGWTKSFDISSAGASALGNGLAADSSGNAYFTGNFNHTVTFGGSDTFTAASGNAFLTKYSRDGTYQWTKIPNATSGFAGGGSVAVGPDGSLYTDGFFSGTVAFGGSDTLTDASSQGDSYLSKYGADGTYQWTKDFDTTPGGGGYSQSIATGADGKVYVAGVFAGTVDFGGSDTLTDAGGRNDGFVSAYNSDGTYQWTRDFDTTGGGEVVAQSDAVSSDGHLYVTGSYGGPVAFGGSDSFSVDPTTEEAFLTSYQVFIPSTPNVPSKTLPVAPNTGYGAPSNVAYAYIIIAVSGFSLIVGSRLLAKTR